MAQQSLRQFSNLQPLRQSLIDAPVGDLSCQKAAIQDAASDGAIDCVFVPSNGDPEAIYQGSLKTELSDDVPGAQAMRWIVRSAHDKPQVEADIGQIFSGGGSSSEERSRALTGQGDDSVRLELDPLMGGSGPKWTTAVLTLKLIRVQV